MAESKLKLTIKQGATFRRGLKWKTGTPAAPVDLTGYTARMQIREEVTSADVLATLTTENGGITLGGAAGTIVLYLSPVATAAFDWESGVYDIEMIAPNTDVIRLVEGGIVVSPEVTR